jgi:predicted dehydrogenase
VSLQFADGMLAQAACSFETVVHRQALIAGDAGVIETTYLNHTTEVPPLIRIRRGNDRNAPVELMNVAAANGFRAEAEAFAVLLRGGAWTGISERESIDVAEILDTARAQVEAGARR